MSAFFKMLYQKCQYSDRNRVFLSSKVSGKGSFCKVENADMCPTLLVECRYRAWDKCFLCVWSTSIDMLSFIIVYQHCFLLVLVSARLSVSGTM